jgi:thiopurine S-methyltransferase
MTPNSNTFTLHENYKVFGSTPSTPALSKLHVLSEAASSAASPSTDDKLSLWEKLWSAGDIGWHKADVSVSLKKHEHALFENGSGARVLVPLCGKTVDMKYFAANMLVDEVVGVDCVKQALEEFATEHPDLQLNPVPPNNGYGAWKGDKAMLLQGDFFNLDVTTAGGTFEAAWDCGSLSAIQPSLRDQYVEKLGELMSKPYGKILLSACVRLNGDTKAGPPFSTNEGEIRRLFEGKPWVKSVDLRETMSLASTNGSCIFQLYLITTK